MSIENVSGWKKWVGGFILVFLLLSFVFFGIGYYMNDIVGGGGDSVAVVAGKKISRSDFAQALQYQQRQMSNIDQSLLPMLKQRLLSEMIMRTLLLQKAYKLGFRVPDSVLRQVLHAMPDLQQDGTFSRQKFLRLAQINGMSEAGLLTKIRESLVINQMQASFTSSAVMVPDLLLERYKLMHQLRDIGYILIDPKQYVSQMHPGTASIEKYYSANRAQFQVPAEVKLSYVVLDPKQVAAKISINPTAAQQYFQSHRAQFKSLPQWRVQQATITGADAQQLALQLYRKLRQHSITWTGLASNKQVKVASKWLVEASMPPSWLKALSDLPDSAYSAPLPGPHGYVLLRRLQYKAGSLLSYAEAKDRVVNVMRSQQVVNKMAQLNQELTNLAYTQPNSLQPIADQLGLKVQTSAWFNTTSGQGLTAQPQIISASFSAAVVKSGNNSQPIVLGDGRVVVLRALQHKPATVKSLAMVHSVVVAKLRQQMAEQRATQVAQQLQAKLQDGADPKQLASKGSLQWHLIKGATSGMQHQPPNILATAFSIPAKGSKRIGIARIADGRLAVVSVLSAREPDMHNIDKTKLTDLQKQINQFTGQRYLELYLLSARKSAKVKTYPRNMP